MEQLKNTEEKGLRKASSLTMSVRRLYFSSSNVSLSIVHTTKYFGLSNIMFLLSHKLFVIGCLNTNNFSFSDFIFFFDFLFFSFWMMKRHMISQSHDMSHDVTS